MLGLTKAAVLECAYGLRIHTPMITSLEQDATIRDMLASAYPAGRSGGAEEVDQLVAWLFSDKASFVTGACYPVDGGYPMR